jgi:galactose-1-phosphate uridylyltransferase
MPDIRFESREDHFDLLNPLKGFAPDSQTIQTRKDPLLGHTSVYNPLVEQGIKMFVGPADRELIARLKTESAGWCFFCPEKIAGVARFPADFVPEGTLRVGETVLFPNLLALGRHHAVAAITRSHFLEPQELTPGLLADAFTAIRSYVGAVYARDPDTSDVSVNANYLFPAGASVMHPHFQVIVTAEPYTHQARLLEACRSYRGRHGQAYHQDLIRTERNLGQRYIGQTGPWHWLAAYAPLGSNEVQGVHEEGGDFAAFSDADLSGLATGLSAVLGTYGRLGYLSFNFSLYARRQPEAADGFNCLIRCMTRQNPSPSYRTDDFFLQKGLQSELILMLPETLAAEVRREMT